LPVSFHIGRVTAILFDTLRLSRTLRAKGHFTPEQAETLAEALGEAAQGDLATKADLAAQESGHKKDIAELRAGLKEEIAGLRAELKTDIADAKAELKAEIAEIRADILKWVVGAIGFQAAVILGAPVSLAKIFAK
jgi:ATP phosphoribosyltransferase regulatory subunit HisZ